MRSTSIVAAAFALATSAAHADPALPPGWIAGGKAAPMPAEAPPSPRSREALQLASSPLPPAIAPVPVPLDALDRVEIAPALSDKELEASRATPGEPASEVFVAPGCQRVSVSGHAVGEVRFGWLSEPIGPQATGGVDTWHVRGSTGRGDGRHRFTRVTWETIDPLPDGTLRYTHGEARFDVFTCKTTLASRYTAVARPILGGLAFLFRTRCAACAPAERDELHVIKPSFGWGAEAYGHRALPLRAESADSSRLHFEPARLQRFAKAIGRTLPALAPGQDMLIGIEIVKGLGEAAPNVIAYATVVKHVGL